MTSTAPVALAAYDASVTCTPAPISVTSTVMQAAIVTGYEPAKTIRAQRPRAGGSAHIVDCGSVAFFTNRSSRGGPGSLSGLAEWDTGPERSPWCRLRGHRSGGATPQRDAGRPRPSS